MKIFTTVSLIFLLILSCLPIFGGKNRKIADSIVVLALKKTEDVSSEGDAADDSCTFVNSNDLAKSLVIGTDKKSGLAVYDLTGKRIKKFLNKDLNNVDIRYGFDLNNRQVALISAGNRSTNTIDFYFVDALKNEVNRIGAYDSGLPIYGSCMYKNEITKKMYVFANSKEGIVKQFEVVAKNNAIDLNVVREFDVGTKTEGCVVDDYLSRFYISEEKVGIWQYGAKPKDGSQRKLIDNTGLGGNLVADIEGLTIYRLKDGEGYLLASSQGDNSFAVYHRKSGSFVGKFQVEFAGRRIKDTDGIDAISHGLSEEFPNGLVVVQDGNKQNKRQSFKLVSWLDIANKFSPPLKTGTKDPLVN